MRRSECPAQEGNRVIESEHIVVVFNIVLQATFMSQGVTNKNPEDSEKKKDEKAE